MLQKRTVMSFYRRSFAVLREHVGLKTTSNLTFAMFRVGEYSYCTWTHVHGYGYIVIYRKMQLICAYQTGKPIDGGKHTDLVNKYPASLVYDMGKN